MIHLHKHRYEYFEEINDGILKHFPTCTDGNANHVLDVGCGGGALAEAIQQRGYRVWGIEVHPEAVTRATQRGTTVFPADLTDIAAVKREIGDQQFDHLVFSDVLEHLYDPYSVFREYLRFVKPGGRIYISVPNATVWTNRFAWFFGQFNYADTGVMDRTHIRFFTFKTAKALVNCAGCQLERVDYTPFFVRALLPLMKRFAKKDTTATPNPRQFIDSPAYKTYMRFVYPVEYVAGYWWKSLFAFRIILVGRKGLD